MNESTAAALREQAQEQAAVITNLEAGISELQALKAATVEKLDQVAAKNPTDLATQIKLRGEVMAADQMVLEYSERLTAARAELASLEAAARRENGYRTHRRYYQRGPRRTKGAGASSKASDGLFS